MVLWFQESSLQLNTIKTKDSCCGRFCFLNIDHPLSEPLKRGGWGVVVEQVETFTYLVNVIDNHLSITQWANYLFKKAQQQLSLLRRLKSFNVDSTH